MPPSNRRSTARQPQGVTLTKNDVTASHKRESAKQRTTTLSSPSNVPTTAASTNSPTTRSTSDGGNIRGPSVPPQPKLPSDSAAGEHQSHTARSHNRRQAALNSSDEECVPSEASDQQAIFPEQEQTERPRDADHTIAVTELPFFNDFELLADLPLKRQREILKPTVRYPKDCCSSIIVMSLEHYVRDRNSYLSGVKLSSGPTDLSGDDKGISDQDFKQWTAIAHSFQQILVHPRFKLPVLAQVDKLKHFPKRAYLYSTAHLPISSFHFNSCLRKAGVDIVCVNTTGARLPFTMDTPHREPADLSHDLRHLNTWVIGETFLSEWVFLFAPAQQTEGMKTYPTLIPASLDFGCIHFEFDWLGQTLAVKIISSFVDYVKAVDPKPLSWPKTVFGYRRKKEKFEHILTHLEAGEADQMGGYRIEVTVRAPTLVEARVFCEYSPFYDINFWRNPPAGLERFKLDVKVATKAAALANAHWIMDRAVHCGVFSGADSDKPQHIHTQGMFDTLAGIGYNGASAQPTASLATDAWWNGPLTEPSNEDGDHEDVEDGDGGGTDFEDDYYEDWEDDEYEDDDDDDEGVEDPWESQEHGWEFLEPDFF